jgi:hypothetical protein
MKCISGMGVCLCGREINAGALGGLVMEILSANVFSKKYTQSGLEPEPSRWQGSGLNHCPTGTCSTCAAWVLDQPCLAAYSLGNTTDRIRCNQPRKPPAHSAALR